MTERNWTVHPGEVLREEFLYPFDLSVYRLAKEIHVPPIRLNDIVNEKRGISVDTALRLSKFFGTTPQFWLNLQSAYEIHKMLEGKQEDIKSIHPLKIAEKPLTS